MSSPDHERDLEAIRDDLIDGEDLTLAARLIGDTLVRRMRRARALLNELEGREDSPELVRLDALVRRSNEVETQLRLLTERFEELYADFEDELETLADDLDRR